MNKSITRYLCGTSLLALTLGACGSEGAPAVDSVDPGVVLGAKAGAGPDRKGERDSDRNHEDREDKRCDDDLRNGKRKPLQPKVTCVETLSDGQLRAHWGYTNSNKQDVTRKIGANNKFSPGNQDQNQPTIFHPGTLAEAFTNTFASNAKLTWTLDGKTASADKRSPACSGPVAGSSGGAGTSSGGSGGSGGSVAGSGGSVAGSGGSVAGAGGSVAGAGGSVAGAGGSVAGAGGSVAGAGGGGAIDYCAPIGSTCHAVDPGTGPLHDCHTLGHAGDQTVCQAQGDNCLALCGAAQCSAIVESCHPVDPGTGPLHDCHEIGHDGDTAACIANRASCVTQCVAAAGGTGGAGGAGGAGDPGAGGAGGAGGSGDPGAGGAGGAGGSGDPGAGGAGGAGGSGDPGGCTSGAAQAVSINFRALVNGAAFVCGQNYTGVGTNGAVTVTGQDFRMFVQDLKVVRSDGVEVPVTLDVNAWQSSQVALLDFEDGSGSCAEGNPEKNTVITGTVPASSCAYTGVKFANGIPDALNHGDPLTAPAPLSTYSGLRWSWLSGFRFTKLEMIQVVPPGELFGDAFLHSGSTACSGNPQAGTVVCAKPNRNAVSLSGFNPATNTIAVDIGSAFAGTDLSTDSQCHAADAAVCTPMFNALGVTYANGQPKAGQTMFSVQ